MKKGIIYRSVKRKTFYLFLSVTICLMMFASAVSADTSDGYSLDGDNESVVADIDEMASVLNKLNILRGVDGNYMLDEQIMRAEAAAFIIRMLGKDSYVTQNASQFKYTKFIDVISSKWYAPYVGYCTSANILAGTTDSTFEPEEFTTEKQFLKMTLCALGYEYNADFNWSNVYQKAYTVGLVTDSSYMDKTQDNTYYLRSDAVSVIYRALKTPRKGEQVKLIEALVNEGVLDSELVKESGMLPNEMPEEEEDNIVQPLSSTNVMVTLDQEIAAVKESDVLIYESSAPSNTLTVKSFAFAENIIQIITSEQIPNKEYTIIIDNVTYKDGTESGRILGTFTGYVPKYSTSDFFRIMKIEQPAANVINVYFTHPVNENSETAAFYELTKGGSTFLAGSSQNITVKKLQMADNAVSIHLKNTILESGRLYGLKISGMLTSSYGVRLGEGEGDEIDFTAKSAAASGQLEVSSVQAWTITSVRILFNREINRTWAEKRINYTVNEKNGREIGVTKAVVSETGSMAGREVFLSLDSTLDEDEKYELKIEFIPDIYYQDKIEGKTYTFSGDYPASKQLELKSAVSEYNNSVVLTFNMALDSFSASNNKNYFIYGVTDEDFSVVPKKAYYSEKNGVYSVKLFLPEGETFKSTHKYVVYADNLKDVLGEYPESNIEAEFRGGKSSVVKPRILDAVTVSRNAIKLVFNIEIANDANNLSIWNYSLEYVENGEVFRMAPIGVIYVDANTLVLHFSELNASTSYQLKFNSITDYSEVYTRTASDGDNSIAVRFGR